MTTEIAILNKHGVALAADSAVTGYIGNKESLKIFKTANKIFSLSKYYPVGIMIYNNSFYHTTPWELIIKLYRKKLNKNSFSTLEEYTKDFFDFIMNFEIKKKSENSILLNSIFNYLKKTIDNFLEPNLDIDKFIDDIIDEDEDEE